MQSSRASDRSEVEHLVEQKQTHNVVSHQVVPVITRVNIHPSFPQPKEFGAHARIKWVSNICFKTLGINIRNSRAPELDLTLHIICCISDFCSS